MDTRRLPRTVVDPKVRRVGFFTSGDSPPARSQSVPADTGASTTADGGMISSPTTLDLSIGSISFSPVMIPPPRYASADGIPALGRAAATAPPVSVHNRSSPLRRDVIQIPIGSFNPSEYMQGTSAMLSPSSSRFDDLEFSEEVATAAWFGRKGSGKEVASFPGSSEEMMMAVRSWGNSPAKSALTTASVVKTLPGVTAAKDGGTFIESQNEGAGIARAQKQKTTKAERRAIQEAQRFAKSTIKEAGWHAISLRIYLWWQCSVPLSVNMGNAIRFLKSRVLKLHHNLPESEAKSILISDIDRFINEKIIVADKVIINHAVTKIRDGDVLLVYGHSTVVEMIVLHALELGKQFRIVVVDSRPKFEGQKLLRKLVMKGIICTYTHLNAISYIMHEVTSVFLGASSVLSNGTVYARVGTACVAMVAHAFQVPVLICCETYKFHERILLDSICSNELGDPDVIIMVHGEKYLNPLEKWVHNENLRLLNLFYDATPSDYVSMIVTEHGMIPPTSVPVIVREYERDQLIF